MRPSIIFKHLGWIIWGLCVSSWLWWAFALDKWEPPGSGGFGLHLLTLHAATILWPVCLLAFCGSFTIHALRLTQNGGVSTTLYLCVLTAMAFMLSSLYNA